MAPSELTHALAVVDERLKTAHTVALSLLIFAAGALIAVFAVHGIAGLAGASAVLAVIGGLGAIVASRMLVWQRTEIYDEIVLSGFRHVGGPALARHAADLISPARRKMFANTLERFVEVAVSNQLTAVPLDRRRVRELRAADPRPVLRGCARSTSPSTPPGWCFCDGSACAPPGPPG